jgi:hypothetical protein
VILLGRLGGRWKMFDAEFSRRFVRREADRLLFEAWLR